MQTPASSTFVQLFLAIVLSWLVSGCGGDATGAAGETPLHYHLVCVSPDDAELEPCDDSEGLSFFNSWVQEAIFLPHSTFSTWSVDPARQQYRHVSTACVPTHWPAPVWKNKADFITRARQAASGTQPGKPGQDDCHPPKPQAPGIHQLAVSGSARSLHPAVAAQLVSAAPAPPHHQAIVCDVSASTLAFACDGNTLLRAFDFWVARGLVRPGSSLSVALVGASRDTMRTVFDLSVPARSLGERIAFILVARAQLAQLPGTYFNRIGIFIFVPDFEALIADEALLDADFGATNRESARRALS